MPNTQRGFKLPPDVYMRKERLSSGDWASKHKLFVRVENISNMA